MLSFCHPGTVRTEFMMSVHEAVRAHGSRISSVEPLLSGPALTISRNRQVERFLASDAKWLWMLDTDMVFSPATLPALLASADPSERPVMGAVAMTLQGDSLLPAMYAANRDDDGISFSPLAQWPTTGLLQVDATGCACLLIHRDAFRRISKASPADDGLWFAEICVNESQFGEDISFCLRCLVAEIPVLVDTRVTVGHVKPIMLGTVSP